MHTCLFRWNFYIFGFYEIYHLCWQTSLASSSVFSYDADHHVKTIPIVVIGLAPCLGQALRRVLRIPHSKAIDEKVAVSRPPFTILR